MNTSLNSKFFTIFNSPFSIFNLIILCSFLSACGSDATNNNLLVSVDSTAVTPLDSNALDNNFRYNLKTPNTQFNLKKDLREISGMAIYQDKWIAAVQDELGIMFLIDMASGEILNEIEFAQKGDYEGIACVKDAFYALQSDGVLFQIENWQDKKNIKVKTIPTDLSIINNAEGLDYDWVTNDLLIACKGSAVLDVEDNSSRSVFAYDLDSAKLKRNPTLDISRKKFKKYIKANIAQRPSLDIYSKEIKKADKAISIAPSAIAVHPINEHFYILSAVSSSLIVMNRANEILYIKRLPQKEFEQPEGLAFSSNGDMFISTEGQKKKAKIYKFDYIK